MSSLHVHCVDLSPFCVFVPFCLGCCHAVLRYFSERESCLLADSLLCPFVLLSLRGVSPSRMCPSVKFFILGCREFLLPSASFTGTEPFLSHLLFKWTELLRYLAYFPLIKELFLWITKSLHLSV